jgi:HK97 family phage prohead protease
MSDPAIEQLDAATSEAPAGELRFRQAKQLAVSFPERMIELVVMPYEEETVVEHPTRKGTMIREIIARGAFDGVQRRAGRIKVNRDHDVSKVVGRTVALHPSREEGLVAEVKISNTPLGDETLTLADDEVLDASAGYLPMPGGEKWLTRSSVRIVKGWLGHIAMVPEPAYEGSRVLAVRAAVASAAEGQQAQLPTPNLDQVRAWLLEEQFRQLEH